MSLPAGVDRFEITVIEGEFYVEIDAGAYSGRWWLEDLDMLSAYVSPFVGTATLAHAVS